MKINILSIFPSLFKPFLETGIIGRAKEKEIISFNLVDIRDFSSDSYGTVDDSPYGGGAGMVMKVEPILKALESIKVKGETYLLSPRGKCFNQNMARELSKKETLSLICGRYKGVDERVRDFVDGEISIGDYILTGGELPAMVVIDCLIRMIPGVLGEKKSLHFESFEGDLLEYPQYTRPAKYKRMAVPAVLLSGNHNKIEQWRQRQAIKITRQKRPDLLAPQSS